VIFIQGIKRVILSLNLLKYLIITNMRRNKKNHVPKLYLPLFHFLIKDKENNVELLKFRIYRLKLIKMLE